MSEYNKIVKNILSSLRLGYRYESSLRKDTLYRIMRTPDEHDSNIYFQLVGKGAIIRGLPEELMHSDLLLGFSKADITIITHLGTKKELEQQGVKPKLWTCIAQQIFGTGSKTKFMLKMPEQEQLVEAVPEEVMTNKEALNMLEGHEAAMIGYAAAENRLLAIKKEVVAAPTCRLLKHDLITNSATYLDEEREAKHTMALEDIFYNKKLLSLFGKLDQQMISFVVGELHQQKINPKQTLPVLSLLSYIGHEVEYQNVAGESTKASFMDIAFDSKLLDQFSQKDRDLIRFAAGELSKEKSLKG